MKRHKKRIGVLTLTIFLLMTFISGVGTVLASEKVPVTKGAITKPSINSSGQPDNAFNPNVNYNKPHLDDLKVRWGSGSSWDRDLIDDDDYGDCFDTSHSLTVDADEVDVYFDPHKADWSEWWVGDSTNKHRQNDGNERTISDVALEEGDNIITIRVGDSAWSHHGWYDYDVLTVTLTITRPCTVDDPHLDSLKVDGQELITDSSKKKAPSHSITIDKDEVDVVFDPHKADWSEWWYGTSMPDQSQRHRSDHDIRTISDVDLEPGDNIITIRVGDKKWSYHHGWYDCDVLTVTLTITKPINYKITLDKDELTIRRGRQAELNAQVVEIGRVGSFMPECDNRLPVVNWGFVLQDEAQNEYVIPISNLLSLSSSGEINNKALLAAKSRGKATVIAYLGNNYINTNHIPQVEQETLYLDEIPADLYDTCEVTINSKKRVDPLEPEPEPLPDLTAPPAIETLDVTITIGSEFALVNGEQVTLTNNPLLIGEDRAMVDYADMVKLIPGLEVVWDWQTLSVTFSKDGKELKMILDEIPAGFDVPFMNIAGRLVVPVRYVGNFYGATVDWIGDTLVVHMYK